MARRTSPNLKELKQLNGQEQVPTQEAPVVVQEAPTISFEDYMRTRMDEMESKVNDLLNQTTDHEMRLMYLGDKAKPIPMEIGGIIKLDDIFSRTYSEMLSKVFVNSYRGEEPNPETISAYIAMSLKVALHSVEDLAQRFSNSHKT